MFCTRIPRFIEDGSIRLRPLRVFDGPFLMSGLKDEDILSANGLNKHIASSWLFVWWWIKKTFTLFYCIECDSNRIGFIGLYNLMLGKSAEMALEIFDNNYRRLGYGSSAFNLFSQVLKRYFLKVIVKVKTDNHASIAFWTKLGFEELYSLNDTKVMSLHLKKSRARKDQDIPL